jgi:primosomal protein N' (replication factor Y)
MVDNLEMSTSPSESSEPPCYVEVALNLPLNREFSYRVPNGVRVAPGNRVRVPFRGKLRVGIVTRVTDSVDFDPAKALDVSEVIESGLLLPDALMQLARRMSEEYGCSLGESLDAMVPAAAKTGRQRRIPCLELKIPVDVAQAAIAELEEKHQQQSRVMRTVLELGSPARIRQVRQLTGTSDSPWKTLVKNGLLKRIWIEEEGEPLVPSADETAVRHDLNEDQQDAVDRVTKVVGEGSGGVFLLHGVTGSGKTEVYLRILEEVRAVGKTAIVLVPEISLTPQTVGRFASRFPDVAVLHSGLTDAERGKQWRRLMNGKASIAIGARSALFAPIRNLGLIVIDEEHEGTFKQESTPRYHARAMAVARGEIENAVVVLGSATPSLESYGRAKRGVYQLLALPRRAGSGTLPRIVVEDLRGYSSDIYTDGVPISPTLRALLEERLRVREQAILFLNRRGFTPVLICPKCGTVVKCRNCDISMVYHVRRHRLVCHYCREEQRRPDACEVCRHDKFHDLGAGTERVEAAIKKLFPSAIVARMDADTMTERGAYERVLSAFRRKQVDVLIGTQMIAKGLDFPDVTLVGVVSADNGLFMPDYRAAERTFQLLYQVSGRAGRAEKPGIVVFQTMCPDNYAVQSAAKCDYESFVQMELQFRRAAGYPPFSRLIRVLVEGVHEGKVKGTVRGICDTIRGIDDLIPLGPAPAVIGRIKNRHRMHCMAKCMTDAAFRAGMERLTKIETKSTSTLRITLDVDPGSLM